MKRFTVIIFTLLFCQATIASDCMDKANNQLEMNVCAKSKADKADEELNHIYKLALKSVINDESNLKTLRQSERAWIAYRNAQINLYYPPVTDELTTYGSFHPVCVNSLYEELTRQRIKELKAWLKKPDEGDMCGTHLSS